MASIMPPCREQTKKEKAQEREKKRERERGGEEEGGIQHWQPDTGLPSSSKGS